MSSVINKWACQLIHLRSLKTIMMPLSGNFYLIVILKLKLSTILEASSISLNKSKCSKNKSRAFKKRTCIREAHLPLKISDSRFVTWAMVAGLTITSRTRSRQDSIVGLKSCWASITTQAQICGRLLV